MCEIFFPHSYSLHQKIGRTDAVLLIHFHRNTQQRQHLPKRLRLGGPEFFVGQDARHHMTSTIPGRNRRRTKQRTKRVKRKTDFRCMRSRYCKHRKNCNGAGGEALLGRHCHHHANKLPFVISSLSNPGDFPGAVIIVPTRPGNTEK